MVFSKVASILAEILDIEDDEITSNMELTPEFEIEKIHIAKLVIACEKKFKISIYDEKVHTFHRVSDIVKYIEDTLEENEGNDSVSTEEDRMWWYYS